MSDMWLELAMVYVEYYVNYGTKSDYENCERRWSTVCRDAEPWLDAL